MKNNPVMRAAFEKDFEVKWEQASPQLQLGYAKGFFAGRQMPLDFDLSFDNGSVAIDFDPSHTPSLRELAQIRFNAEIKPHLSTSSCRTKQC